MAVKSTIFEIQQSFLHIFGVAQNFQLNCIRHCFVYRDLHLKLKISFFLNVN